MPAPMTREAGNVVTTLIATSVVRGSHQGGESRRASSTWWISREQRGQTGHRLGSLVEIDWQGRGWDRGLRGIAFDGDPGCLLPPATSCLLYTPDFQLLGVLPQSLSQTLPRDRGVPAFACTLPSLALTAVLGFDLDRQRILLGDARRRLSEFRFKAAHLRSAKQGRAAACSTSCTSTTCTAPRAACT